MGNKKKYLHGFSGIFGVLLFFMLSATYSLVYATEPEYNSSRTDDFFGSATMNNVVTELGLSDIYSGDALESLTYWANKFMYAYNTTSGDLSLQDLVIQKGSNNSLYFYIGNITTDNNNRDFIYIETTPVYSSMKFVYLDRWVYSGQNISYPLTKGMVGNIFKIDSSTWTAGSSQTYHVDSFTDSLIYLSDAITFIPYTVAGYTQTYGYGWYFLDRVIDVETGASTSGDSGDSGDFSSQLNQISQTTTEINQGIAQIHEDLTSVPSGDDFDSISSGDILDALDFQETEDPYENFWGSFTSGLSSALTSDVNTPFEIDVFGTIHTIYPDDWVINYPTPLRVLLATMCTVAIVILELKMWRRIIILVNTGNLMSLANGFSKKDITDLF